MNKSRITTAVYPGSFDPVTNGHLDVIHRSVKIFDNLIVAVLTNPKKNPLFTKEERMELIRKSLTDLPNVQVDSFEGLLVDYAKKINANAIVRGLRAVSDFEVEFQMANINRNLYPHVETIFMMTGEDKFFISSNMVREVSSLGGSVKNMVPKVVFEELKLKFPLKE